MSTNNLSNCKTLDDRKSFFMKSFKKYYEGDYKFLNSVIGTSFLQDVQNIFTGILLITLKIKIKRIDNQVLCFK